jgi:hypothetical protein
MCIAILFPLGVPLRAQDSARPKAPPAKHVLSPAEQFKTIERDYEKAMATFIAEYRKAKTDPERQKVIQAKYPNAEKPAHAFLDLAQKNPRDPVAIDALVWVLRHNSGADAQKTAANILLHDHLQSPKMRDVALCLTYSGIPQAEQYLHTLLEKNPHKEVKGIACYSLAQIYKRKAERENPGANGEALYKQAEQYCNQILAEFADVKSYRLLGDLAKSQLFEMQHLRIGMPAPNIEGEDLDGKKFALKDYRGKVVLLDFWGNW